MAESGPLALVFAEPLLVVVVVSCKPLKLLLRFLECC